MKIQRHPNVYNCMYEDAESGANISSILSSPDGVQ